MGDAVLMQSFRRGFPPPGPMGMPMGMFPGPMGMPGPVSSDFTGDVSADTRVWAHSCPVFVLVSMVSVVLLVP